MAEIKPEFQEADPQLAEMDQSTDIYHREKGKNGYKPQATGENTEDIDVDSLEELVGDVGDVRHSCDADCLEKHHHASFDNYELLKLAADFFAETEKPRDPNYRGKKRGVVKHPEEDKRLKVNKLKKGLKLNPLLLPDFSKLSLKEKLEILRRRYFENLHKQQIEQKYKEQQAKNHIKNKMHHKSASQNVEFLKNHYKFSKIFANIDSATQDYLMKVYSDLKVEAMLSGNDKEYSEVISKLASLMIEKGYFKK
jgi:hypothetical protein